VVTLPNYMKLILNFRLLINFHRPIPLCATVLSKIELLFNVTPHISTGYSPYEILLSKLLGPLLPAVLLRPVDQIRGDVRVYLQRAVERRRRYGKTGGDVFHAGDYVLLRESSISNAAEKVLYLNPFLHAF
jgi:hypothetical protein